MTTLEKIKAEIEQKKIYPVRSDEQNYRNCAFAEVLEIIDKYAEQEPTSPCDLCRFNPPSSADGKPCTMCPAESEDKECADKGVLEQLAEKQNDLSATVKAWSDVIEKNGYVN